MKWTEFCSLLAGIGPETALGRIVSIRMEEDADVIKNFTPEMKKERNRWRSRMAKQKDKETCNNFVEAMKKAFLDMAGLGGGGI